MQKEEKKKLAKKNATAMKCLICESRHILLAAIFIALVLALIYKIEPASASTSEIYINEVMWDGSSVSSSDEWLELINLSDQVVDLSGWSIYDEVKGEPMLSIDSGKVIGPKSFFLIANNAKDHKFSKGESILDIDPDLVNSEISLSNDGFKISLRKPDDKSDPLDPSKYIVVDVTGNGGKPCCGEYGGKIASMQRVDFSRSGDDKDAWRPSMERKNLDDGISDYATPKDFGKTITSLGLKQNKIKLREQVNLHFNYSVFDPLSELKTVRVSLEKDGRIVSESTADLGVKEFSFKDLNVCPKAVIYFYDQEGLWAQKSFDLLCYQLSTQIKFYEILPHPKNKDWNGDGKFDSNDEWLELVNFGQNPLSLAGWKIKDKGGKSFEFTARDLTGGGSTVLFKSESKISLNDEGDELTLLDPEGREADKIAIGNSSNKTDYSYAKWDQQWFWTTIPTPEKENQINQPGKPVEVSYQELSEAVGRPVIVKGELLTDEGDRLIILLDGNEVLIRLLEANGNFMRGEILTVSGVGYGGIFPYLLAHLYDIKAEAKPAPASSNFATEAILPDQDNPTIKIKKKIKKRLVFQGERIKPMVLGQSIQSIPNTSKTLQFMLYSMGLIMVLTIVFVYDVCCRF